MRHRETWKAFEFEKTERFNLPNMTKFLFDRYDNYSDIIASVTYGFDGSYGMDFLIFSNEGLSHRFDIIGKDNFIWKMVSYRLFNDYSDDGLKEEFQKQLSEYYELLFEAYKK